MTPEGRALFWLSSIGAGIVLSALLIAAVFVTGQTFGQRCAVWYTWNTPEWKDCVHRMGRAEPR